MCYNQPMSTYGETDRKQPSLPPVVQAAIALLLPPVLGLTVGLLLSGGTGGETATSAGSVQAVLAPIFAVVGGTSWLLGLFWYGLKNLGLRGGRPLFSGIAFASLGWLALLPLRFYFVRLEAFGSGFDTFFYLLVFEAFAVQLWLFGLLVRAIALWRGPLTAAISSGILFGFVSADIFQEAYGDSLVSLAYFMVWGIFYGIIRLRTGSFLGIALVQATQSFTTWTVLLPPDPPDLGQIQSLHLAASLALLIFIWRLWPKQVEDYRV
jgi:hypothetical protein